MDLRTGIRAVISVVVIALLVACGADAATPSDGARSHTEPPPSIATAIAEAEAAVADALSEAGVEYNPCGRMCTENFWRTATPADVQAELDKGASVDATIWGGVRPLYFATAYGKWPAVAALLDAGAEIDAEVLVYAIQLSNLDTVALLLERGADPNAHSEFSGGTPLPTTDDPVIAALLIAHGADVNAQNRDGATPLINTYIVEVFTLLLANSADVAVSASNGWTPLHHAVYSFQDAGLAKLLLERGADVNARTEGGESVCDLVKANMGYEQPSDLPPDIDEICDLVCP